MRLVLTGITVARKFQLFTGNQLGDEERNVLLLLYFLFICRSEGYHWFSGRVKLDKRGSSARGTKLSKSTKSSCAFCDLHPASCGLIPLERQFDGRRRDVQQFDRLSRERADASAGQDDAGEVERIGGGDLQRHVRWRAADRPQQVHRLGPRELFAQKTGDETTAPNFAASFHTAERHQQVTPRRSEGLAGEKVSKNHAPSQQKLAGEGG